MKYTLFALLSMVLVRPDLSAQITLNSSDYPASVIGTDSLKVTSFTSTFPSMAAAAGGMWDLSAASDTTPNYFVYRVPSPTYQFADSNYYNFAGYAYQGNVQSTILSTAILEYGTSVQRVGYSLTALTGGSTDSVIINNQDVAYSSPRKKIAFPTAYLSIWGTIYEYDFSYEISASVLSLTHALGVVKNHIVEKDTVIGWGKMRVKDAGGSPSLYFDVLQVKAITTTTDSFFINGLPASGALLTLLNVSQGQKTTTYEQNYYRVGEVTPLANVQFRDSTFTTPYKATTHVQRLTTNAISGLSDERAIKIYPNPVSDGSVSVELPSGVGSWVYELTDISGRKTQAGNLLAKGTKGIFDLQAATPPGTYYLKLSDGRQIFTKQLQIAK